MAAEDATSLPVMTLMFCTTLATIYLSYVFWSLGGKNARKNVDHHDGPSTGRCL